VRSKHLMNTIVSNGLMVSHGTGTDGCEVIAHRNHVPRKYYDLFCDVGVLSLGHSPTLIRSNMNMTARHLRPAHTPNLYDSLERNALADSICAWTGMDKVFFCNSGTEAVEAALKLALKHQFTNKVGARQVWSYKGGFHGRTYGALAVTDGPDYYYAGMGPFPDFGQNYFTDPEEINWEEAAAVILSPIFVNQDVKFLGAEWHLKLRRLCTSNRVVLIHDEVQTGSGRTGPYVFSLSDACPVAPDVITLAKGIAGGLPLGAMFARGQVAEAFEPGSHFSTFGGNALCCSVAYDVGNWILMNRGAIDLLGATLENKLSRYSWAGNVRGAGGLWAFDYAGNVKALAASALDEGVIIGAFRSGPGPVKLTPPLNTPPDQIIAALDALDWAHKKIS
jgi:acetylornithine/N-succinyldiaminopimelate aminotransferase